MQIELKISFELQERIKEDPEQERAIYLAYNKKRGYGKCIFELPVNDSDSFMSNANDENDYEFNDSQFTCSDQGSEIVDFSNIKRKYVGAGSILKLIPQFDAPLHRMGSPIQSVRVLEFTFPVNSVIFSGAQQTEKCVNFKHYINAYDFKRVTAVKYHKDDDVFSIDIEEKNLNKEPDHHLDSNEIMYYYDWLTSQGNKEGLEFLQKQKGFLNRFKKRIVYTPRIELGMEHKVNSLTEKINKTPINQPKQYGKKIDDITMEWIKTMPYIIRKVKLLETERYLTADTCEEKYSKKYQELIGMSTDNKDKIFSDLRNFKCIDLMYTTDVAEGWIYINTDQIDDEYSRCGLQKPYKIMKKNSCIIKSPDMENVLEGHFVQWIQEYKQNDQKFMENIQVYIVDKKIIQI